LLLVGGVHLWMELLLGLGLLRWRWLLDLLWRLLLWCVCELLLLAVSGWNHGRCN
jgi:hypothetical protein